MSHFLAVVLVKASEIIGPGTPFENLNSVLSARLQPFHEFECTGEDDQYVRDIDETQKTIDDYNDPKETRHMLRDRHGKLFSTSEDRFYRELTPEEVKDVGRMAGTGFSDGKSWTSKDWEDGKGYRTKMFFVPPGFEEVTVPIKDVLTLREFVEDWHGKKVVDGEIDLKDEHKYGYAIFNGDKLVKSIDRTNPNAHWDYWTIGGRWTGALGKYDPTKDEDNYKDCGYCNSTGTRPDANYEGEKGEWSRKGDGVHPVIGNGCNVCLGTGKELKFPSDFKNADNVALAKDLPNDFSCFAFVTPEGEWIQRGSMGWWGMVSNEVDDKTWRKQILTILAKYNDCLAVAIDCHT